MVEFQPAGLRVEVPEGTTILEAAWRLGRDLGDWGIRSVCGGQGRCGQCRVRVEEGGVAGADEEELELLLRLGWGSGYRLACRAKVFGRVKVQLDRVRGGDRLQVVGKVGEVAPEPVLRQFSFRLSPPAVGEQRGDADRLAAALLPHLAGGDQPADPTLAEEGLGLRYDLEVLRSLAETLRGQDFQGRAVVRGGEVIALGRQGVPLLGLAIDLGTTKIAGYLTDLETGEILQAGACLNPQVTYGDDVISRLGYASSSPENYGRIRKAVLEGLGELAQELCARAGYEVTDIQEAVVGGNTAMHHLLLGLGVAQLARAPYVPALTGPVQIKSRELGMRLAPGAYVHVLPCVAGYVGGDHVAALLSTRVEQWPGVALLLDVGTNTEISLAKGGLVTCCSCASGPAFEGGHVTRGMRALPGAIDRVWVEDGYWRFRVIGGGEPVGFCGAALLDLLAVLLRQGIMDPGGRLRTGMPGVQSEGGLRFVLAGVPLTQGDIRQLQLAKAAIRSGIEGLLRVTGTQVEEIDRVYLAGAFGVALDPESAMSIGMFPKLPRERFVQVGNAAGMGAYLALISRSQRSEAARLARAVQYLELMTLPAYQDVFLACLSFPALD